MWKFFAKMGHDGVADPVGPIHNGFPQRYLDEVKYIVGYLRLKPVHQFEVRTHGAIVRGSVLHLSLGL